MRKNLAYQTIAFGIQSIGLIHSPNKTNFGNFVNTDSGESGAADININTPEVQITPADIKTKFAQYELKDIYNMGDVKQCLLIEINLIPYGSYTGYIYFSKSHVLAYGSIN